MGAHASPVGTDVRAVLDGIRRIVQVLRTSSRDAERQVGLTAAQLFALQQLAASPGASVNELAARTYTHQSSVSVVVQRLVARKLVVKVISKDDRRRVRLALTDAGRAVLRRSPEPVQDRLIAGIAALPATQRQILIQALGRIAQVLATADAAPPMLFEERGRERRATQPRERRGPSARARRA
jgi:DNA-binding MarR family transcriptional regulator